MGQRARRLLGLLLTGCVLAVAVLAARRIGAEGWPLAHSDDELVAIAGALIFLTYPLRTAGWRRLFAREQRPRAAELLAANGAACVSGAVLPSQGHHVVKAAVLRRLTDARTGLETIAVSLLLLSLVDAVALVPLAAAGAATTSSETLRSALIAVALGGTGAAALLLLAGRLLHRLAALRWRRGRLVAQAASRRVVAGEDLCAAIGYLALFWAARALGTLLLLAAMGISSSPAAAVIVVTLMAASAVLPVGFMGSLAQVGSAAAALAALGVAADRAVTFGLASSLLVLLAGAALAAAALLWRAALPGRPVLARAAASR
jgi:hypothetical protein